MTDRRERLDRLRSVWLLATARAIVAAFCLTTAVYAVLTSSPFAYEQFIQPNMLAWLSNFVFLHVDFYWLTLCLTILTLAPYLGEPRARAITWSYLAAATALGLVLIVVPVLPAGNQPLRSLIVAVASTLPILWLAAIDHLTARPRSASPPWPLARMFATCAIAAVIVWIIYAGASPMRLRTAGGLSGVRPLAIGVSVALVSHLAIFTIVFLVWRLAGRAALTVCVLTLALVLRQVVFVPIAVTGASGWVVAAAMSLAVTLAISGVARHLSVGQTRTGPVAALIALPFAAYAALSVLTTFDWGFMLQKLSALACAIVAFAAVRSLARQGIRDRREAGRAAIGGPLLVLAAYALFLIAVPRVAQSDFVLDAYSAADPSYRLARQFLDTSDEGPADAAFYASLRANTSIAAPIAPVSVDFVKPLDAPPASSGKPPHIFFFIIDSLRRDYVSAYNSAVTFTPRFAAFARDSVVFERAFSRYGGTGLSVPAIWAGALLPHKQYVTPFAPMNALGKLLDAAHYRRVVTRDHITEELFGFPEGSTALDHDVPEMMHTFCGTLEELKEDVRANAADPRPIFAHTRPLDLHIGNTRLATVPPGESYPGFFAPYAARVRRIDTCFGTFVDELVRAGLYDDSIVIVMSDHGDSLGEGLRWGHGYTVEPEVLRIPLIVHLPASQRGRFVADATRLAFATDVTPTLYTLLGYSPQPPRAAAGATLFAPAGTTLPSRRRDAFTVASSYGAVYGTIRHNGRMLYIADAIEGRDYLYDLNPVTGDTRVGMTDADRRVNRALIRDQLADVAAWYGLPPR